MADEEKQKASEIQSIRTLKTDELSYARDSKTSLIQIAAEQLKKRRTEEVKAEQGERTKKTLIISAILLLVAISIGGVFYFFITSRSMRVSQTPVRETLLTADLEDVILLQKKTRDELLSLVASHLASPLAEGEVRTLGFLISEAENKRFLRAEEIIQTAELGMPSRLLQNIQALELGSISRGGIHSFVIFKVRSYPESFAAMLEWEKYLAVDIGIFFPKTRDFRFVGEVFRDMVIKNQDARVLAKDGQGALAYTFFNRNLLIISSSDQALGAILERMQ